VPFDEGHVLVDADHAASGIFLVLSGVLLVETPLESYERGPGHVLGEWEALDGSDDVRVTAQSDVRLVAVSRADYEAALTG
jgi:CRP-like cAMP-binding protein